jgi:hypothetical protein
MREFICAVQPPGDPPKEGSARWGAMLAANENINYNRKFFTTLVVRSRSLRGSPNALQQNPAPIASACERDASVAVVRTSRRSVSVAKWRGTAKSCLLFLLAVIQTDAQASSIDTEHLFGFTIGSDVGEVGERELEGSVTGGFGKQTGTYAASSSTLSAEFVPLANLRTEITGEVVGYDITGVSGLADQQYAAFGGLSADIRYKLLDRATAPFGFAIGAEPRWGRADEETGQPGSQYGVDFVAAFDREIVPDRIVAAFNLLYQPETMRSKLTGLWSQESTAGAAVGVMAQVRPGIFVGGEARYLRQYDGFGLDALAGQAFFVGPTVYVKLSEKAWIAAAWSAQVTGQATTAVGSLDLVNFERRQARLLFGVNF